MSMSRRPNRKWDGAGAGGGSKAGADPGAGPGAGPEADPDPGWFRAASYWEEG